MIYEFNDTNILIVSFLIIGSLAAGSWGVTQYINRRKTALLLNRIGQSQPVETSLFQQLAPDRLVRPSPKVRTKQDSADCSPWKNRVILPGSKPKQQNSWRITLDKLISETRLVVKYMRRYWTPYWAISILSVICLMSSSVYQLFFSQMLGVIVDQGATAMTSSVIKLAVGLPLFLGLVLLGERLTARLTSRIANDIRYDLFSHLQVLSQDFHKDAKSGDLLAHFSTDMEKIERAMGKEIILGISDLILVVIIFGIMLGVNGVLALLSLLPIVVMLPVIARSVRYVSETGLRKNQQKALMMDAVQEGLRGQMMIAGYGLQSIFGGYFGGELKKLEDADTEGLFGITLVQQISLFSVYFLSVLVLGVGTSLVLSGRLTIGTLLAFWGFSRGMYDRLSWFLNIRLTRWIEASVGLQRIDPILQQQPTIVDGDEAYPLPPFQHQLCFEQLCFGYDRQQHQLQDLNLTIKAGQFVAFVGPSGAGKSTIFNLLMRFYDVSQGRIIIDGHDLRQVTQASLRKQIGVVLQETFLFNTTIMDNICIVKPDATEAEAIAAAQAAEVHDFILSLPEGYQTVVGEGGGRLSGGQRQRIAIARALLYNPPILLLDEPTSSLSPEMANSINQAIAALGGQHTVILITHQLQGAVNADQIFVLEQGQLVEQGTHPQLLASQGLYYHLWNVQN
uniref:Putative ABC transporter n=1 Tax=Prochloron didemni P1-Palau TaxID=910450 RepID=G0XS38_PRODI|nr:putative ABC transporter [Prochloron didemni P1-Palau]